MYDFNFIAQYQFVANILTLSFTPSQPHDLDTTVLEVLLENAGLFEYFLKEATSGKKPELSSILAEIEECNFTFFEGKKGNAILQTLTSFPNTKGRRGKRRGRKRTYENFQDRWKKDGDWRDMFGDIVIGIEKRLCEECFRKCGHNVSDHAKSSHLYAFHFDHMLKYWKKVEACSSLKRDIAAMLLESIKCRLACAFCHEQGNVPGYEEKLKQVCQLQYNFGNQHRTAAEGLGIKEMALFVPEIKSRGVLWKGKDAKVSWRTLEVLVWRYFKVILTDLVYWTSDDWIMKGATDAERQKRGRIIPNTIIVNLLKKLGVECPGCSEDFVNKTAAMMTGIHMDHRGKKRKGICECVQLNIDILIDELKRGECDPTCAFCHGEITAWEEGRETEPSWV